MKLTWRSVYVMTAYLCLFVSPTKPGTERHPSIIRIVSGVRKQQWKWKKPHQLEGIQEPDWWQPLEEWRGQLLPVKRELKTWTYYPLGHGGQQLEDSRLPAGQRDLSPLMNEGGLNRGKTRTNVSESGEHVLWKFRDLPTLDLIFRHGLSQFLQSWVPHSNHLKDLAFWRHHTK